MGPANVFLRDRILQEKQRPLFSNLTASPEFFRPEELAAPLDWTELFGPRTPNRPEKDGEEPDGENRTPDGEDPTTGPLTIPPRPIVEVEVGCGNGRYLRRGAEERPDHLFVGIERSLGYARKARDRMVKYGVGNARIVRGDATKFLASHFADGSIHTLHVYFTDPWPKRKHGKRRLFQTPFFETMRRTMRPGGRVYVKVDLFWYFEEILCRFDSSPHFRTIECGVDRDCNRDLYEITGFEQKALAKKGRVFFIVAENRGPESARQG